MEKIGGNSIKVLYKKINNQNNKNNNIQKYN